MKIRTWDKVIIIAWKDKWKTWKVLKVFRETDKIIVEKVNVVTKHVKKSWTTPGQIVKMEKAIDVSNASILCPFTEKPTKVWYVIIVEKKVKRKFRFSKKALKEKWGKAKDFILK